MTHLRSVLTGPSLNLIARWKGIMLSLIALFTIQLGMVKAQVPSASNYTMKTNNSGDLDSVRFYDQFARRIDWTTSDVKLVFGPGQNAGDATSITPNALFSGSSRLFDLTFGFRYMGVVYTKFNVTLNGGIGLGAPMLARDTVGATATDGGDRPVINAFEMNMRGDSAVVRTDTVGGKVHYKVVDTPYGKVLVVEWRNMNITNKSYSTNDGTWQVRLYERTGEIEFVYGKMNITNRINDGFGFNPNPNNRITIGFSSNRNNIHTVVIDTATYPRTEVYYSYRPNPSAMTTGLYRNYYRNGRVRGLYEYDTTRHRAFRFTPYNPSTFMGMRLDPYLVRPGAPLAASQVSPTALRLSWGIPVPTPPATMTGVLGYLVYKSEDGINWERVDSLPGINRTTTEVVGLTPGTPYQWRVVSYSEGSVSEPNDLNQPTPSWNPTVKIANVGTGRWSDPTTWSPAGSPSNADSVIIPAGATVLIDSSANMAYANCAGLLIRTNGRARFIDTTAGRTLYIHSGLHIEVQGVLEVDSPSVNNEIHKVICAQGINVNGVLDLYRAPSVNIVAEARALMVFNSPSGSIAGQPVKITGFGDMDFYKIVLDKKNKSAVVEVDPAFYGFKIRGISGPLVPSFLSLRGGTFRIRGVFQQGSEVFDTTFVQQIYSADTFGTGLSSVSTGLINPATGFPYVSSLGYLIPENAAFELQNPNFRVIRQNASAYVAGTVSLFNGVMEVGLTDLNGFLLGRGGILNMFGDSLNVSGRVQAVGDATYTQTGGVVTVGMVGNISGAATFDFTTAGSSVTYTGGKVVIQNPRGGQDYLVTGANAGAADNPGTTLQIGNQYTSRTAVFNIRGNMPNLTLDAPPLPANIDKRTTIFNGTPINVRGNVLINDQTVLDLGATAKFCLFGGEYFTNHDTVIAQLNIITFNGSRQQKYISSISARPTGNVIRTAAVGETAGAWDIAVDNDSGLVLDPYQINLKTQGVWFWTGGIINSHKLTMFLSTGQGPLTFNNDGSQNFFGGEVRTQYGFPASFNPAASIAGNFDVPPVFDFGTARLTDPGVNRGAAGVGTRFTTARSYTVAYEQHSDATNTAGAGEHLMRYEIPRRFTGPVLSSPINAAIDTITNLIVRTRNGVRVAGGRLLVINNVTLGDGILTTDSTNIVLIMNRNLNSQLDWLGARSNSTGRPNTWVRGPLERRLTHSLTPTTANNFNVTFFPVGQQEYSPFWLSHVTTQTPPVASNNIFTDVRVGVVDATPFGQTVPPLRDMKQDFNTGRGQHWYAWAKGSFNENAPGDPVYLRSARFKVEVPVFTNTVAGSSPQYLNGAVTKMTRFAVWDTTVLNPTTGTPLQILPPVPPTALWMEAGREHENGAPIFVPQAETPTETQSPLFIRGGEATDARVRSKNRFVTSVPFNIGNRLMNDTLQRVMYFTLADVCPVNIYQNNRSQEFPDTAPKIRQDTVYATSVGPVCENEYIALTAISTCSPFYKYKWNVDTLPDGTFDLQVIPTSQNGTSYPAIGVMDTASRVHVRLANGRKGKCDPYTFRVRGINGRVVVEDTINIFFHPVPSVDLPNVINTCSSAPIQLNAVVTQYTQPNCNGGSMKIDYVNRDTVRITDNDTVYGVSSFVTASGVPTGYIPTQVCFNINHTDPDELQVLLEGPDGQSTRLVAYNGAIRVNPGSNAFNRQICFVIPPKLTGVPTSGCPANANPIPYAITIPGVAPNFIDTSFFRTDEECLNGLPGINKYAAVRDGRWRLRIFDNDTINGFSNSNGTHGYLANWMVRYEKPVFDSLTYTWQNLDGTRPIELNDPRVIRPMFMPLSNPVLDPFADRFLRLIVTDQRTSCQDTDTVAVRIGRVTDRPSATNPPVLCGPGPVTLRAFAASTSTGGGSGGGAVDSLVWFTDSTITTPITNNSFNSQVLELPFVPYTDTFYVAQWTNIVAADGSIQRCFGLRRPIIVTVNPLPVPATIVGPSIPLCPGPASSAKLIAKGATDFRGTYVWYDAPTGGNKLGMGAEFNTPNLTASRPFYVETIENGCTSATRTMIRVEVNAGATALVPPTVVFNQTVCDSVASSISVNNPNASGILRWFDSAAGGREIYMGSTIALSGLTADSTLYVEVNDGICASRREAVTLSVAKRPVGVIELPTGIEGFDPLNNLPIILSNNSIAVRYAGTPGDQYIWEFGDGAIPGTAVGPGPHAVRWMRGGRKDIKLRAGTIKNGVVCERMLSKSLLVNGPDAVDASLKGLQISLYPNPTRNATSLNISVPGSQKVTIEVRNNLGQVVMSEQIQVSGNSVRTLELARFGSGIYNVEVKTGVESYLSRVVVE